MNNIISIIVPCFNGEKTLKKTLNSIVNQKIPVGMECEIIVVDNNSSDSTKKIIEDFKNIIYEFEPLRNRSKARNRGIQRSRGEIICFFDADVILEPGWVETMHTKISSSDMYGGGEGYISSESLYGTNIIERLRKIIKNNSHTLLSLKGRRFPGINTAGCIYRKSALIEAGLFDENLNYHEDIDLSQSVFRSGYVLFENKNARLSCFHDSPRIFSFIKRNFFSGKEFLKYQKKWSGDSNFKILFGFIFSQLICIKDVSKKFLKKEIQLDLMILRIFLYLSSCLGSMFGIYPMLKMKRGPKQRYSILNYSSWGLVEHESQFTLYNVSNKEFKKIEKILPVNKLIEKMTDEYVLSIKKFLVRFKNEIVCVYLTGSHLKNDNHLSRKDIDVLIITKTNDDRIKINKTLKQLNVLIKSRFDIVVFPLDTFKNGSVFHLFSIHMTNFSVEKANLIIGTQVERITDLRDGVCVYQLYLKKCYHYLIEQNQSSLFEIKNENVDFVYLYKFILYFDMDITSKEEIENRGHLYLYQLNKIPYAHREVIKILDLNHFILSREKVKSLEKELTLLTKFLVKKHMEKSAAYIKYLCSTELTNLYSEDIDNNFLHLEIDNIQDYKETFIDSAKEKIKVLRNWCE